MTKGKIAALLLVVPALIAGGAMYYLQVYGYYTELEPQIEQISAEVEASIEAKSSELEALIESRFGDEFEARIEATTDALDDMVEECRDADLTEGETRIISRSLPEGRKVKIACVKGDKATLRSASVREAISSNPTLCRTEKKVFFDEVGKDSDLAGADD